MYNGATSHADDGLKQHYVQRNDCCPKTRFSTFFSSLTNDIADSFVCIMAYVVVHAELSCDVLRANSSLIFKCLYGNLRIVFEGPERAFA